MVVAFIKILIQVKAGLKFTKDVFLYIYYCKILGMDQFILTVNNELSRLYYSFSLVFMRDKEIKWKKKLKGFSLPYKLVFRDVKLLKDFF